MTSNEIFNFKKRFMWYTFIRGVYMKIISICMAKLAAFFCTMVGRGSTFPGVITEKFDKNIINDKWL